MLRSLKRFVQPTKVSKPKQTLRQLPEDPEEAVEQFRALLLPPALRQTLTVSAGDAAGGTRCAGSGCRSLPMIQAAVALQTVGASYQDETRLIQRLAGTALAWTLLNGPLAGLSIEASLQASRFHLRLSTPTVSHYALLLRLKNTVKKKLSVFPYHFMVDIEHVTAT